MVCPDDLLIIAMNSFVNGSKIKKKFFFPRYRLESLSRGDRRQISFLFPALDQSLRISSARLRSLDTDLFYQDDDEDDGGLLVGGGDVVVWVGKGKPTAAGLPGREDARRPAGLSI